MSDQVRRREFLAKMGATLGGVGLASGAGLADAGAETGGQSPGDAPAHLPSTNEIRQYLLKNSPWVNVNNTVDTVPRRCRG